MKKWLAIFLALLFALAMIHPAAAQDPTPTPPAAKMHVVLHVDDPWSMGVYVESGSVTCITIEGGFYTLSAIGTATFDTNDYTCQGELSWHIYYGYGGSHHSGGEIKADVFDTDPFYYDADFQSNYTVTLYTNESGTAPAVITPEAGYGLTHGGAGHTEDAVHVVTYIYIHDSTMPPCGTDWESGGVVASGTIAATNETGVAATLAMASEYRLTVSGGPWNDGVADRHDTALKIGSDDWIPTSDFAANPDGPADCTKGDPLDPNKVVLYFHATDVDWKIRVNDVAGEFGDNTGSMDFVLELMQVPSPTGCQSQYLRGALIASGNIQATSSTGVHPGYSTKESPYFTGNWIEILTSGGPWRDANIPPDLYTIAIKNSDGSWSELSAAHNTACFTPNGDYVDAWYQLPDSSGIDLRVDDPGEVFGNNWGSMNYTIYASTYSPVPPGGCDDLYSLGTLIKTVTAPANAKWGVQVGDIFSGKEIGKESQAFYAIETSGFWNDGSTPEVWGGLAASSVSSTIADWYDLATFPTVACAVQLDPAGHWRVYIPDNKDADNYWVRAQENLDDTWANNSGSLQFKIYRATYYKVPGYEPGPMPGPGGCDPYYTPGSPEAAVTIQGNDDNGVALPALTSGKVYAVATSAGPWSNDGDPSYEVAISPDNGANWYNLSAWTSAVCAESVVDENHILVYFQALAGRQYRLRVYDPGENFTDNTDSIDYKLYEHVTVTQTGDCSDDYVLKQITVSDPYIPAANPGGVKIPLNKESGPDSVYAIEIGSSDYWNYVATPDEQRYDAQISGDNGSTWDAFAPGLTMGICIIQSKEDPDSGEDYQKLYRIYFHPPNGALKMRVNQLDPGAVEGKLKYTLYGTQPKEQPCTDCNNPTPPGWQAECYESYLRPSYLFKLAAFQLPSIDFGALGSITFPVINVPVPAVDDWIAYLQWTVRSYFAWCPEHTAALAAIPLSFNSYEPFGTIAEVNTAIDLLDQKLELQKEQGGENSFAPYSVIFATGGGEGGAAGWQGLLPVLDKESPWAWSGSGPLETHIGENVTFDPATAAPAGGESDYVSYCKSIFDAKFGATTSAAMCAMTYVARSLPFVWILIQLGMDVGSVVGIIAYIQKRWIDPRMSA
jgi:hypothetical protein